MWRSVNATPAVELAVKPFFPTGSFGFLNDSSRSSSIWADYRTSRVELGKAAGGMWLVNAGTVGQVTACKHSYVTST